MPGGSWGLLGGLVLAKVGLDPLPLPTGWGWLGPVQPGEMGRDAVVFDGASCAVRAFVVDVDAGPYARDVRVARTWDGDDWRWADDWQIRGAEVFRPGRKPALVVDLAERLESDAAGRVTARVLDGRRVEILRDPDGRFRGMAAGTARVWLDDVDGVPDARATSSGGDTVGYDRHGLQLVAANADGRRTLYTYEGLALRSIAWADGGALRLETDGTSGTGGRWRCTRLGDSARLEAPGGLSWALEASAVADPGGARAELIIEEGRLVGWNGPSGASATLERDTDGRVVGVKQAGENAVRIEYDGDVLSRLSMQGSAWGLSRSGAGTVASVLDPSGRQYRLETDALGLAQSVAVGATATVAGRDSAGRPLRLRVGNQGEVRLEREGTGRIVKVHDATGGIWTIEREGARAIAVVDAAGGRWALRRDALGRLVRVDAPDARGGRVVRQGDAVVQVQGATGGAWSFLRDASGALAGIRDPAGRLWGLARDAGGELRSVRNPLGESVSVVSDGGGRWARVGDRTVRRDRGFVTEVAGLAKWKRDDQGRTLAVDAGPVSFRLERDAAGRVTALVAGEARWSISRDAAGLSSGVSGEGAVQLDRDSAGLVSRLVNDTGTLRIGRDLRGRVDTLKHEIDGHEPSLWDLGRDAVGRVARAEGPGGLAVGADYDRGGELSLLRLGTGTIIRRNVSADAGEVLAIDARGDDIGWGQWVLDDAGLVSRLELRDSFDLQRDAQGLLRGVTGADGGWSWTGASVGGWDGLEARIEAGRPVSLRLAADGERAWGLDAGEAEYRWDGQGRLLGLDGSAGRVSLEYDSLGRLTRFASGKLAVTVARDALGRLSRVGSAAVVGWDGLLALGEQVRVPMSRHAVARPGGAVLLDPRGYPFLAPWVGGILAWPGGLVPGVDAAETGAGGRLALPFAGPLLALFEATDPVTGTCLACAPPWPWASDRPELPPAASPTAAPDAFSPAPWDPALWDGTGGWHDPVDVLVGAGLLGGASSVGGPPGLPWLPPSFAPKVPAPLVPWTSIVLDEDPVDALVLRHALDGEPLDIDAFLRAEVGAALAVECRLPPGLGPDLPGFVVQPLATEPLGH